MNNRIVEPEILDRLPAEHPDAIASRRDLRIINAMMGNTRWLLKTLRSHLRKQDMVAELGAGDGLLGKQLAWNGNYIGLELVPRPNHWPETFGWEQGDFLQGSGSSLPRASVVIGGLVLHHFSDEQLHLLGEKFHAARLLIFCEPARRALHLWQGKLLRCIGINKVTQHDLPVSVRAGFLGEELPLRLGLSGSQWHWTVTKTFFGAYRMVAQRKAVP